MKSYRLLFVLIFCSGQFTSLLNAQPQIGVYPPQIHQQICQESTFTRYLDVINYGNDTMIWGAGFTPGPYSWVVASPLEGIIAPKDTGQIAFYFNSSGLAIDNYYAYLQINSNDPVHPDTIILAMLHVQQMNIIIEPENDSVCYGCTTTLITHVFGCSEERIYEWTSEPPGFHSTDKSPVVTPAVNTLYRLKVADGGGIAYDSVFIKVYGSSGLDEPALSLLKIYPNPSQGKFSMFINSKREGVSILKIFDFSGRLVCFEKIELKKGNHQYMSGNDALIPGIYFVSVMSMNYAGDAWVDDIKLIIK